MRNKTADILKGLAVIFMVQVHLTELFAIPDWYSGLFGKASLFMGGPPAAPVFMAVMGYFLAYGNKNLKGNLYRGVKLLVWGFLLNVGLNMNLFVHIFTGKLNLNPWDYLFGVDILFLAGLSVIVVALVVHFFGKNKYIFLALIFVLIAVPEFFKPPVLEGQSAYFLAYFYSNSWWSYFPVIPWMAYVLTGYLFNLWQEQILLFYKSWSRFVIGGVVVLLIATINFGFQISTDLPVYYHHGVLFYGFTLIFMILWLVVCDYVATNYDHAVLRYVQWLGKNVTVIYVFQWLFIGNLATWLYKAQSGLSLAGWFVLILFFSSIATLGWRFFHQRK